MSAREKVSLTPPVKKLGIIAGGGVLPQKLFNACIDQGVEPYVIGLRGHVDVVKYDFLARHGAAGKIIKQLRKQNIQDVVFIGAVKRPTIFNLWPDWLTIKFLFKICLKRHGDNSLLSKIRSELEGMGFKFHGVHEFLPEILIPEGILGKNGSTEQNRFDIQVGLKASQELGAQDIGQAVIVKAGEVIGREDRKGTSALIRKHGTEGAILVKTCKPQQDKDLDLPAIGPETAKLCADKNMAGIVGQAGHTLMVEQDEVIQIANDNGLFVIGVTIHD